MENVLQDNLSRVRAQIAAAAARAGRAASDVTLVAVTKYVGLAAIRGLIAAGQRDLGESRVQQLMPRVAALGAADGGGPTWHLIGNLQRNKAKYLIPRVRSLHAVDSVRLAEQISGLAQRAAVTVDVFVEVNVSGEASKHGVPPGELDALLSRVGTLPALVPVGLMTMAPYSADPEASRPHFARLRELLAQARQAGRVPENCRSLSMGMSGDFAVAIEEGATHVRVGSALFDGLTDIQRAAD